MSDNLYTVILDWNGGTYISQLEGKTAAGAKLKWLDLFDFKVLELSEDEIRLLKENVEKESDVPSKDLSNVRFISTTLKFKWAFIYFIPTQK